MGNKYENTRGPNNSSWRRNLSRNLPRLVALVALFLILGTLTSMFQHGAKFIAPAVANQSKKETMSEAEEKELLKKIIAAYDSSDIDSDSAADEQAELELEASLEQEERNYQEDQDGLFDNPESDQVEDYRNGEEPEPVLERPPPPPVRAVPRRPNLGQIFDNLPPIVKPNVSKPIVINDPPKPIKLNNSPGKEISYGTGIGSADPQGMTFVKNMMRHAWGNYVKYAWGMDEIHPISKTGKNWLGSRGLAATIIDSLDTLYIMGMFQEFERAKEYVVTKLDFNVPVAVSFFETVIRVVGGLLSAYDLSGDYALVEKAIEIADRLLPAFDTGTGIPRGLIDLSTGASWGHSWAAGSILAEYGSIQLEFKYLSDVTGNKKYEEKAMHVIDYISKKDKPIPGLYPTAIDGENGDWRYGAYTVGALADSFYEYLLKNWLISDKHDVKFRKLYDESSVAITQSLIRKNAANELYLTSGDGQNTMSNMEHLTCFAGGMFALGAASRKSGDWQFMLEIGANLTETCYHMYSRQRMLFI